MRMIDAAVIVCPEAGASAVGPALRLGGLSLAARSLLTAQQAGIRRLAVVGDEVQREALAAETRDDERLASVAWLPPEEDPDPAGGPCLLLLPDVVLAAGELRAWGERLTDAAAVTAPDATGLGPLIVPPDRLAAAVAAARRGRRGLAAFLAGLADQGELARLPWQGALREGVKSPSAVPAVERRMLRHLRTPEDGPLVDRFVNRTVSGRLSRALVRTPVTPNQVTVLSLCAGLLGAWTLGSSDYLLALCGLLLFQLSVILDHVDGEVARLKYQFSPFGKWLDNWSDHAVDVAAIGGLAWRAAVEGETTAPLLLGAAAAVGVTGSFLIVFWWSLHAERAAGRLPAAVAAMANRDGFCLALWAAVLLARPGWFLWALALGANAYWLIWFCRAGLPPRGARAALAGGRGRSSRPAVPPDGAIMTRRSGWFRQVGGEIWRRLVEHDLMMMAAAISFYWLLAFIPMLLLGTSAVGYLLGSSEQAVEEIMQAARRFIPRGTGPDVQIVLRGLIQNRVVTGLVGLGTLLWIAMGLFEIITNSLTQLSGERETRSYLRRKLVALLLIGTVGLLFAASLVGSWTLAAWWNLEELIGIRLGLPGFLLDPSFPRYLTSFFMGAFLTVIYRVAPVRGIRWPWAIAGGAFSAVLWHQAKLLFNWYLTHYARYNLFYGILGGFVGLILWIFYTAIILLLGGIVADVLDRNGRTARRA